MVVYLIVYSRLFMFFSLPLSIIIIIIMFSVLKNYPLRTIFRNMNQSGERNKELLEFLF